MLLQLTLLLYSCLWHLLPEIFLSLQEANKSQEYSDSWILDNNYPSLGIEQGKASFLKKPVKNHKNGYDALSLVQFF